jgi:Tol biopolymer transport system component
VENHGLSPDGRWLAYDANRDGNQEIYVVPVEGGETRQLTTDPGDDFHPDFSPDGREIAFYSMRHGTRDLFLMSADGANEVRLTDTPGQERHPSFSPDGLAITYVTGEGDGTERDGGPSGHIMVITRKIIGGEWSDPRIVLSGIFDDHPRWSPDGRWIVSARGDSIVATTLDGTLRVVLDGPADGFEGFGWPEWSPDGQAVYFTGTDREGTRGIWTVPFEGGMRRLLVSFDDPTQVANLSGMSIIGDTVYVSITKHESDIYVMDLEY